MLAPAVKDIQFSIVKMVPLCSRSVGLQYLLIGYLRYSQIRDSRTGNGTLYRLSITILAMRSGFFKTLFSLPRNPTTPSLEGTNDEQPIILCGIEQVDFDYLLRYMIGG
jgi:hypothetical protein